MVKTRTIFSKLVAVFIAILFFAFSATGALLYFFLTNFVASEKMDVLKQSADNVNSFLNYYIENQNNPYSRSLFDRLLESVKDYTGAIVWVVDTNGYIIISKPELPKEMASKLIDETGYPKLPDERQYKKVMQGQEVNFQQIGDFYGFFKDPAFSDAGYSWLTVQKPFYHANNEGKQVIVAAVYLHTPLPEVHKARTLVFRFFIFSVVISILLSIILVYFFSRKLTMPLKEINNAARVIAGGDFKKRLQIKSNDEIGELAETFNNMVTDLENLEDMRRGFIANVSHELRTPMTSIRGFIEGILDGTIPQEKHRYYLAVVRDETNRLNRLVNDLLDLARMEAGELNLKYKSFNINELIRRSIIKLETYILNKNLQIEADFEQEELFVRADSDCIERVIINLMHNAIKFTPEQGKIVISTSRQKELIRVSIQDNGIGIGSDDLDRIWDRFYKTDKSRGGDKAGTGLGLAIVKNIITEHKQDIWVESQLETGTKFTFTLERTKKPEDEE